MGAVMKRVLWAALAAALLLSGCSQQPSEKDAQPGVPEAEEASPEEESLSGSGEEFSQEQLEQFYEEYFYPVFLSSVTAATWDGPEDWDNPEEHWPDRLVNCYTAAKYYSAAGEAEKGELEPETTVPQQELEEWTMARFDVTADFLRQSSQYDEDRQVYVLEYLGGAASSRVVGAEKNGDVLSLSFEYYSPADEETVIRTGVLDLRLEEDGYRFVSCTSASAG